MTEPLAVLFAGIGGAIISGVVGVASAAVSLRAARRQSEDALRDRERDRQHQSFLALLTRRHSALEDTWRCLFLLERNGQLDDRDTEAFVRQMIWLPAACQHKCLALLRDTTSRKASTFAEARSALIAASTEVSTEALAS